MKSKKESSNQKQSKTKIDTKAFQSSSKAKIGTTTFLIRRHFSDSKSLEEAIYELVKSEAAREQKEL